MQLNISVIRKLLSLQPLSGCELVHQKLLRTAHIELTGFSMSIRFNSRQTFRVCQCLDLGRDAILLQN